MNGTVANPKGLGFGAIAISGWTYSMVHAGWFSPAALGSGAAHSVAVFATYALLVAALASFLREEPWHAVFFMTLSAFWWGVQNAGGGGQSEAFGGWYYLAVAVFVGLLWMGSLRSREVGDGAGLVALGVALAVLGLSLADLGLGGFFEVIGGYVGLVTALVAFWVAASEIGVAAASAPEEAAGGGYGEGGGGQAPR